MTFVCRPEGTGSVRVQCAGQQLSIAISLSDIIESTVLYQADFL